MVIRRYGKLFLFQTLEKFVSSLF